MSSTGLIAHWPLRDGAQDVSGGRHGKAVNVVFAGGVALFNGVDSVIEVPDAAALRLDGDDFTVCVRVKSDVPMRSAFGDILGKYDPECRCGVNLTLAGSAPAYCGMSDTRHVHFGIDDGYLGPWEDCGRPWPSNPLVSHLIVFNGEIYAGATDAAGPMDACRVFRWANGTEWIDCGRLGADPNHLSVMSMCVHQGKLYAGTGVWDWIRAEPGSVEGFDPGRSRVFVYDGGAEWRDLGQVGESVRVHTMASFQGNLYVGLDRAGGGHCFMLDGETWVDCGAPNGDSIETLMAFGGELYGATHGLIYRFEGPGRWACIGDHPHGITQNHSIQVFGGKVHVGTWPQGYVLRYENGEWINTGRLGIPEGLKEINEINALCVHNGKLYAGVLPKAQVYRYEADGHWTLLDSLSSRPDYAQDDFPTWGRVTSLTSFRGRLFACTGSCQARAIDIDVDKTVGRVWSRQIGQMVSHERDIGGDWTHIAGVRRGRELRLYVNGELSARSTAPAGKSFDLANTQPLRIGFGPQASFCGSIAGVRLYRGALGEDEIAALAASPEDAAGHP